MKQPDAKARSVISLPGLVWLNVVFWVLAPLVTVGFIVCAALIIGPYFLLFRDKRRAARMIRLTITRYGAVVLKCGWPLVRVRFVDDAPDDAPPCVFVANHRSASDAYLMGYIRVENVQVLNIWPSRIPLLGLIGRLAGYLRVREMPFEEFMRQGSKLLADGVSIIAFPEGTRSGSPAMGPFHGAAFRLAQQNGVKIVPLAISGNENIPHRGSMLLHPGRIVVSKLPAVTPEQYSNMSAYVLKTRVRQTIQRHLDEQAA